MFTVWAFPLRLIWCPVARPSKAVTIASMSKLTDRVQNSLDEARMLVLGCQILIGVQFRTPFEARFEDLSPWSQNLRLVELMLLLIALAFMLSSAAYHRIVVEGKDDSELLLFVSRMARCTLLPFAAALAL